MKHSFIIIYYYYCCCAIVSGRKLARLACVLPLALGICFLSLFLTGSCAYFTAQQCSHFNGIPYRSVAWQNIKNMRKYSRVQFRMRAQSNGIIYLFDGDQTHWLTWLWIDQVAFSLCSRVFQALIWMQNTNSVGIPEHQWKTQRKRNKSKRLMEFSLSWPGIWFHHFVQSFALPLF